MDIRPAIRNLIYVVSNFITESKLKAQLDQLYLLTIKPDSNLEDIEKYMINLGKNTMTHHKINSQPILLPSPKQNKVQLMSGVNSPAFSSGMPLKTAGFGSRIQYPTPLKSNRDKDDKQNNSSDRQISFKFDTPKTSPKNVKSNDKQIVDINQKIKLYTEMPQSFNTVPIIHTEYETQLQNKITPKSLPLPNDNNTQRHEEEQKEIKYDLNKISGKMLQNIHQNMKEMKSNTFKLIKVFENTCEIKTQSSVVHSSHVDASHISLFRKSKNPLFNGIRGKITDQDLNSIQQNFLMKKLIVKAKPNEEIQYETPKLDIFFVTSVKG
ncbi:unnamed protein product (macronuclear) [Paramecium tetraurelia]|uniref:Uncharacterized protein n=1 Tax=Paramecium tetraurelia TaxID=5888 RepID=A0DMY5_PARTE|nr:uncharacterized protein GSPATT00018607001 [Paramecium tetraurelia]CAK84402.1 unnamed protein product [Paramecium tetraurelia]|eukprot:XP_001451799.1 hypothetical protein (macronuclear) [Paramecium tetraurelia strain d4-2]